MNTRQLLAAQKKGAQILHNGAPVEYEPARWPGDRDVWVWSEDSTRQYRYTAAQCQAYFPEGESG